MKLAFLVALTLLTGCHLQPRYQGLLASPGGLQPPPATWAECTRLDRDVVGWSATGVVVGVLGGGSGITTAFFDAKTPRYITGGISVTLGALSALSGYMVARSTKKYAERCTVNTGGN